MIYTWLVLNMIGVTTSTGIQMLLSCLFQFFFFFFSVIKGKVIMPVELFSLLHRHQLPPAKPQLYAQQEFFSCAFREEKGWKFICILIRSIMFLFENLYPFLPSLQCKYLRRFVKKGESFRELIKIENKQHQKEKKVYFFNIMRITLRI